MKDTESVTIWTRGVDYSSILRLWYLFLRFSIQSRGCHHVSLGCMCCGNTLSESGGRPSGRRAAMGCGSGPSLLVFPFKVGGFLLMMVMASGF